MGVKLALVGLNPFFFRSESHPAVLVAVTGGPSVLIPFSSGRNPISESVFRKILNWQMS